MCCLSRYYACLCGHEELVQYLLASGEADLQQTLHVVIHVCQFCRRLPPGAKCEANTFDGERCMYGSLSDSVRRLLKDYKCVSVRAMQRDDFIYFLHM